MDALARAEPAEHLRDTRVTATTLSELKVS